MTRVSSFLVTLGLVLAAPAALAAEGDYNNDGVIDDADQQILMDAMNTAAGDDGFVEGGDHDGDGAISLNDVALFLDIREGK
jgi:hypothetical protein